MARTTIPTVWIAAVAASLGCGARVDNGNTGSETHWLDECTSDAECGAASCLCESCTRGCSSDADCRVGNVEAHCVVNSDLRQSSTCDAETPSRVCAAPSAIRTAVPAPSGTSTVEPAPNAKICDGSDAFRLVVHTGGGGLLPISDYFTAADGRSFLVIDGHCKFWVSRTMGLVHQGTLLDASPLEEYERATFGRLDTFADNHPGSCADGPVTVLWDPSGVVTVNYCGDLNGTAPPGWVDAFTQSDALVTALAALGEPSSGPLRLILDRPVLDQQAPVVWPWPLALDPLRVLPEAALTYQDFQAPGAGFLFPPGTDAETLRAARGTLSPYEDLIFTSPGDPDDVQMVAYMRDELPPHVKAALDYAASLAYSTDACIRPEDAAQTCTEDADCCGSLHCCTDCGGRSGLCVDDPDPCATCLENGGSWVPRIGCSTECVLDIECFTDACPAACAPDNCGGCFSGGECWVAGCDWSNPGGSINETCQAFTSP